MKTHILKNEQFLPISIEEAWAFFSTPKNLSKITPKEMGFVIKSKFTDEEIYEGMKIEYTVKPILGIPLNWRTRIGKTQKPFMFTDVQEKGPYKLWEHTHTFVEKDKGVLAIDEVKYQLPFGILGDIAHSLFVKNKLKNIFDYRRNILQKMFT